MFSFCFIVQVSIADVTAQTKMFSLAGPESSSVLEGLGATAPGPNQVALMGFQNGPVVIAGSSGLSVPGYTLMVEEMAAGELWRSLAVKARTLLMPGLWIQLDIPHSIVRRHVQCSRLLSSQLLDLARYGDTVSNHNHNEAYWHVNTRAMC